MPKKPVRKRPAKSVLRLPDLDHLVVQKNQLVLDSRKNTTNRSVDLRG